MENLRKIFLQQKKTVVFPATFVALQVCYGIPNERVPKSPLVGKVGREGRVCVNESCRHKNKSLKMVNS